MAEPLEPRPPWFRDRGLEHDPFSPDAQPPPVLYQSLRELLDLLQHLVLYGHQLVALLGPPGAGKRTLYSLLLERSGEECSLVRLSGGEVSDREGLLFELLQAWQVNVPVSASLAARELLLRDRLASLRQAGKVPLLLVTEAERLPEPALRLLCTLSRGEAGEGRLQVVLFAEESLRERLEALEGGGAGEDFVHWLEMPRMEDGEAFTLLQERWRQAGGGELPLARERVAELNDEAGALPGPLLRAAAAELAGRAERGEAERWSQGGRRMAVGGALLLLLLLGLFLWLGGGDERPEIVSRELEPPAGEQAPAGETGETGEREAVVEAPPLEPEIAPAEAEAPLPAGGAATAAAAQGETSTEKEGLAVSDGSPSPDAAVPRPPPVAGVTQAPATALAETETRPQAGSATPGHPATSTPAGTSAQEKAAPVEKTPERPPPMHPPRTAAWLRGLDPDSYVIQVFGSHEREAALRFIRRYRHQEHFAWFETRHRGRPWYVVVYGHYPDRGRARAALARLPASLRKERPWLRRVGDIQQALHR